MSSGPVLGTDTGQSRAAVKVSQIERDFRRATNRGFSLDLEFEFKLARYHRRR